MLSVEARCEGVKKDRREKHGQCILEAKLSDMVGISAGKGCKLSPYGCKE